MNKTKKMNICILSYPISGCRVSPKILTSFISILIPLADKILIISEDFHIDIDNPLKSKKIEICNVHAYPNDKKANSLFNIVRYLKYQILLSKKIIQFSDKIDLIFLYGGSSLLIPNLCAHLLGYKVATFAQCPDYDVVSEGYTKNIGKFLYYVVKAVDHLNFTIADMIIPESKNMIDYENLTKYKYKVLPLGARYVDNSFINCEIQYNNRDLIVGFIGRFEKQKGLIEFIDSIPIINFNNPQIKFVIGGDGSLKDEVTRKLHELRLDDKVELLGWIPQKDLPQTIRKLKLLVMPSYSEGLPTIALEAMACGTPVLATPVGGIPDIIKDGITGYILDNNTPNCIAKKIQEIFNQSNGDIISRNAKKIILEKYTFDTAVIRYQQIIDSLVDLK